MRDLRLGYGTGQPGKCGCWLVALQLLGGDTNWDGRAATVDPVIGYMCAAINDCFGACKEECDARSELIKNFGVLRPLGTKVGLKASRRRAVYLTDVCIRRWLPRWCAADSNPVYAELFMNQRPIDYIQQATTLSVALEHTDGGKYVADLHGIAEHFPAQISMQLGCILYKTAMACMSAVCLPAYEAAAARDKFLEEHVLPALAHAIDMEQHAVEVNAAPACGMNKFYELLHLSRQET